MKNGYPLLKHLDSPVRFLSFTMGDLICYLLPFFLGALFDSLFFVPLIGVALVTGTKKILKKFPKFYGIRYLYWSLPTRRFNAMLRVRLPYSHLRFLVK